VQQQFSLKGAHFVLFYKRAKLLLESTDFDNDDDSDEKPITVIVLKSDKGLLLTSLKKYTMDTDLKVIEALRIYLANENLKADLKVLELGLIFQLRS
jgi:hypothetical protein